MMPMILEAPTIPTWMTIEYDLFPEHIRDDILKCGNSEFELTYVIRDYDPPEQDRGDE